MNSTTTKYLNYIHASLADASRFAPNLEGDSAITCSTDLLLSGEVNEHAVKEIFRHVKQKAKEKTAEDRLWPIPVLVCPRIFAFRPTHARADKRYPSKITPIVINALLCKDGKLVSDDKVNFPVVIPRDLLDPGNWEVTIGTVADADSEYAKAESARDSWGALIQRADAIISGLTRQSLIELQIDLYESLETGSVVPIDMSTNASRSIESLVDQLKNADAPASPLLETLLTKAADKELLTLQEQLSASTRHLGQMEYRYGLAESQRESLMHHLSEGAPTVLTVDGPPGTGKTTLLLSAIATAWVSAAMKDTEPPIIVASSTNNQAVLNILRAFSEVPEAEGQFAGRWLPDLKSYGLSLPAKSAANNREAFPVHAMLGMGKDATYQAQAFESRDGIISARTYFLERVNQAFPANPAPTLEQAHDLLKAELKTCVEQVKSTVSALKLLAGITHPAPLSNDAIRLYDEQLHEKLKGVAASVESTCNKANALRLVRSQWTDHCANENLWGRLLAGLRVTGPRSARDQAFWAAIEVSDTESIGTDFRQLKRRDEMAAHLMYLLERAESVHSDAVAEQKQVANLKATFDGALKIVRSIIEDGTEVTIQSIETALDIGPRYKAFKIATHYWEARYLIEVEAKLRRSDRMDDSKSPEKLKGQYRRLAKLFPCFVATLHTLPNKFTGFMKEPKPLYGFIDLLIVDEAGQVLPEIGAPSFALASRALVVGDVDQIKPIWSIPRAFDMGNAEHYEIVPSMTTALDFYDCGIAASAGSIMKLAQRATPYAKNPQRGRGMFLREHRRCWPEIIEICNQLAYSGMLLACRADGPRRITPSLGYVHLSGVATKSGTSRKNNTEAVAIAKWLSIRRTEIETAYASDNKAFNQLVAIVTPFKAQAITISQRLDDEFGKNHGITVGTVHALQGAERRIVIFSPVYGADTTPGQTFFDADPSILNVAISRAQDAFLIFGNMHLFQQKGSAPSAIVGRLLFNGGNNEITDLPPNLLLPGFDTSPTALIRDLNHHRNVLAEAFIAARTRLVIVSPFITRAALEADQIFEKISNAAGRGVRVTIISDPELNTNRRAEYGKCIDRLQQSGANVRQSQSGVHSKLILVDLAWLALGSFNWLSAVRDASHPLARYESSLRYDGAEAFEIIARTLKDLAEIVKT